MSEIQLFTFVLVLPFAWLLFYALMLAFRLRVGERIPVIGLKFLTAVLFILYALLMKTGDVVISFPGWIDIPAQYDFPFEFYFTRTMGVAGLGMLLLLSVIIKYSESYLHKENGFHRFFFLLSVFMAAFPFVLYGDNIDVVFIGWEIIGITSVLLIGFYENREHVAVNSWWAISTYRFCDVGLLAATTLGHYAVHTTNIRQLNNPELLSQLHPEHANWIFFVALCIVFASLGKAAQLPLTSWITRALEGPTPSSALYYGALSIGLGPILLLKFRGLILFYPSIQIAVILIGLLTATYCYLVAKTRSDSKSILGLSAVFEVSVMVMEVGLGLYHWVIFHYVANAFLRVFQFLRSMNSIQDFYDNPLFYRGAPHRPAPTILRWLPVSWQKSLYYRAMNGFGLDWFILQVLVGPWLRFWGKVNHLENSVALGEIRHEHVRVKLQIHPVE
jgi:NADH-quinone oxidoreductase subunit L